MHGYRQPLRAIDIALGVIGLERNVVRLTGLEHKLGIHSSPTCALDELAHDVSALGAVPAMGGRFGHPRRRAGHAAQGNRMDPRRPFPRVIARVSPPRLLAYE